MEAERVLAEEVKEFESLPQVQNVLRMIDWSGRAVNLTLAEDLPRDKWPVVTRPALWRALLPHTIKGNNPQWLDNEPVPPDHAVKREGNARFSTTEAYIRDSFDVFLDRLDRFANFESSGLISIDELRPYLEYWIESIASTDIQSQDALLFRLSLIAYIHAYDFKGVRRLFEKFGSPLNRDGEIVTTLRGRIHDPVIVPTLLNVMYKSETRDAPRAPRPRPMLAPGSSR